MVKVGGIDPLIHDPLNPLNHFKFVPHDESDGFSLSVIDSAKNPWTSILKKLKTINVDPHLKVTLKVTLMQPMNFYEF